MYTSIVVPLDGSDFGMCALPVALTLARRSHTRVHLVHVSEPIASQVDLIALSTHGRGGLSRVMQGSVADKVVRGATVPVLVHRPTHPDPYQAAYSCGRVRFWCPGSRSIWPTRSCEA